MSALLPLIETSVSVVPVDAGCVAVGDGIGVGTAVFDELLELADELPLVPVLVAPTCSACKRANGSRPGSDCLGKSEAPGTDARGDGVAAAFGEPVEVAAGMGADVPLSLLDEDFLRTRKY